MRNIFLIVSLLVSNFLSGQVLEFAMDKTANDLIMPDQSGNRFDGTIHNLEFVPDRFGVECRALEFDGNGYIEINHGSKLNLSNQFSLSVWLKLPAENFQWLTLICKGETPRESDYSPAYRVQLTSATVSYNFVSTREVGSQPNLSYPKNQWFHFCFVKDGNQIQVYQDGILYNTFYAYSRIESNSEKLNIGRDIPGEREFFRGVMDELKIYNEALTANKIKKLANDKSGKKLKSACPKIIPPSPNEPENPWDDISVNIPPKEEEKPDEPEEEVVINNPPDEEEKEDPKDPIKEIVVNIPPDNEVDDPYDSLTIGDKINLKSVRFVQSQDVFLKEAYPELKNLLNMMLKHPTLKIELHGHTDNQGNAYKNRVLSKKRVEKVKAYLVDNGVESDRITTQFFGGDKPIADNSQEVTRKLNRRVEVLIVSK